MNPFAIGIKPLKKILYPELYSCPEYVYQNKEDYFNIVNQIKLLSNDINSPKYGETSSYVCNGIRKL